MKFCKDCKWRHYHGYGYLSECEHPAIARTGERSVVTGKVPFRPEQCDRVREDETKCGLEGRFWAPNRKTRLKEWLK